MYSSMYSSTGLPLLSAGATIEPSLFGDFPADGQDQLPDPVLSSDSSAEDDLTLGPDPDSADQGPPPGLSYAQHAHLASQHSAQHAGSHLMAGMMPHMAVPSHHGMNPNLYSQMAHSSYQHGQSQHGHPNGNGMMGGSRAQMIIDPGPQYSFPNSQQHMQPYSMQILSANSELPNPSIRQKRASVEQISPNRYPPQSPHSHQGSQNYSSGTSSSPSTPARRRASTASRGSIDSAASQSPGTPGGSESGYFYRSRDKTNYQQAHKGVIPNPTPTDQGSKRIRCTWTLEETRYLYDILKDATVDAFPEAGAVRAALLKVDPASPKTLEHVRNKKANLIQKAHSRTCSVADVLIADMNKLENESTGSNRNTQALVQARDRDLALANANALTIIGAPTSTSSSPSLSTATSGSSASNGSGMKGDYVLSSRSSLVDSEIKVGTTAAMNTSSRSGKQTAAARGNRRRGGKRSATNSYSNTSAVAPTSTAQQLASLSGTSRSSFDKGPMRSGNGSTSPLAMSPTSAASLGSGAVSPINMSNDAHAHPRVTLTAASASDTGGITIGALSPSEYEPHHHHHAAGLTLLTPPMTEDLSAEHTASVTKSIAGEPSAAALASIACADPTVPLRFQTWVQDCMKQLFASNNEMRTQMGLQSIQLPTAPAVEALTSTSGTHTALPRTEQWITSWATAGSSSPVPSLLGPAVGAPLPTSSLSGSPVLTQTTSPTEREKSPSESIDAKSETKTLSEKMDIDDAAAPANTEDSNQIAGVSMPEASLEAKSE